MLLLIDPMALRKPLLIESQFSLKYHWCRNAVVGISPGLRALRLKSSLIESSVVTLSAFLDQACELSFVVLSALLDLDVFESLIVTLSAPLNPEVFELSFVTLSAPLDLSVLG